MALIIRNAKSHWEEHIPTIFVQNVAYFSACLAEYSRYTLKHRLTGRGVTDETGSAELGANLP